MNKILLLILIALLAAGCAAAPAGIPPRIETGVNPEAWVQVPAGDFLQGQFDHKATIAYDYEIMPTPVTNAQYAR